MARWWQANSRVEVEDLVVASRADALVFVAEADGEVVGLLSASEETDPDYRHAGIDIALRTSTQGQGLGADAVRTLARWLIEERGHHRLTIDPAADNAVAIACYRKVGFRRRDDLRDRCASQLPGECAGQRHRQGDGDGCGNQERRAGLGPESACRPGGGYGCEEPCGGVVDEPPGQR